jgi:hypothetical protein
LQDVVKNVLKLLNRLLFEEKKGSRWIYSLVKFGDRYHINPEIFLEEVGININDETSGQAGFLAVLHLQLRLFCSLSRMKALAIFLSSAEGDTNLAIHVLQ